MDGSVTRWVDMRMDGCADGRRDDHIDRCTDTRMATYQWANSCSAPSCQNKYLFSYVVQAVSNA